MANETKTDNGAVVSAVSRTEQFFNENKKLLWGIVAAIVVIAAAGYAFYKFSYLPKKVEASSQTIWAQNAFMQNNWELALEGDGNNLGFRQIIEDYGSKAGAAVYISAAICEMQKDSSDLDAAWAYLQKYSGDDIMNARAEALKGDIRCAQGNYKEALSYYEKAAKVAECEFNASYIFKAAQCCEALGQKEEALEYYQTIRDFYPKSIEAQDIDKYITRLQTAE